jgi:hypothetical protein
LRLLDCGIGNQGIVSSTAAFQVEICSVGGRTPPRRLPAVRVHREPVEVDHASAAIGYAEVLADAGVQRFRDVSDLLGTPDVLAWVEGALRMYAATAAAPACPNCGCSPVMASTIKLDRMLLRWLSNPPQARRERARSPPYCRRLPTTSDARFGNLITPSGADKIRQIMNGPSHMGDGWSSQHERAHMPMTGICPIINHE